MPSSYIKEKLHHHAQHVYHYGEHGCAISYAIHEFLGLHIIVLVLSGILLAGTGIIVLDRILVKSNG